MRDFIVGLLFGAIYVATLWLLSTPINPNAENITEVQYYNQSLQYLEDIRNDSDVLREQMDYLIYINE